MMALHGNKTDRIIAYVLEHPEAPIKVIAIANALKVNKGSVSLAIKKLEAIKVVKNKLVDLSTPLTRALKILAIVTSITDAKAINVINRYAIAAGLYGSSAKGTNTEESDIDIWIRPKHGTSQLKVAELSRTLSMMLHKRVQIVMVNEKRLAAIKEENPNFYYALVFGSIVLLGEGIE